MTQGSQPPIRKLLNHIAEFKEVVLEGVEISAEEIILNLQGIQASLIESVRGEAPSGLVEAEFTPPIERYPCQIAEAKIGATEREGGSRGRVIHIGGAKAPAFYSFEAENPHSPAFALSIFDMPIKLPKPLKEKFEDVMDDPAEWARRCVEYGADLVSLNLISTDPSLKNTPPEEAANTVKRVLKAVDAPIIVGGSGNREKDPHILKAAAEAARGECIVLNSVSADSDYRLVAEAAKRCGHLVVASAPLDINLQKRVNRLLMDEGLPKNSIIQDPTTAALGYGMEYTYSILERIRLSALLGDEELQMPVVVAAGNAWGAREAWMKMEGWGDRGLRGPLWEAITLVALMLAGADLFIVNHPSALMVGKSLVKSLYQKSGGGRGVVDWIMMGR